MSSVEKHSSSYSKFIANVYRLVYIPHIYVPFSLFQASSHSASSSSSPSSTSGSYKLPQPRSPGRSLIPATTLGRRMYSATPRFLRGSLSKLHVQIQGIPHSTVRVSCWNSRQLNHSWPPRTSHQSLEVPQHIRQRLAAVIDDLKNAIGQEAAKAYLTRITTVESLEFEPGAEFCGDNSWMEYMNEDCMTDASDSYYPTPFLPYENIGEPFLQMTNSQTETDPAFPRKGAPAAFCKLRRESKKHGKRRNLEHNTLDTVVQNLPRSNLLDCLETHWETLKVEGIFAIPSRQNMC